MSIKKYSFAKIAVSAVIFALFTAFAVAQPATENTAAVPERIVSLSPGATEILFAVGAGNEVVAVDEFSNYPKKVQKLSKVGGFDGKTLSIEKILSFEPDFVYLTSGMHDFLIPKLEKYGIRYYVSTGTSVEDVKKEITEIGHITGNDSKAARVAGSIDDAISSVYKKASSKAESTGIKLDNGGVSVYYEVWNAPYTSCGGNTFISDVIAKAGGKNIFFDLSYWPIVSEESIIAENPEVILIPKSSGVTVESVAGRTGWDNINAVKNGKVFIVDDDIYSRPGPRISDAIKDLGTLLYK